MSTRTPRPVGLALAGCLAAAIAAVPSGAALAGVNRSGGISKFSGTDGITFACTTSTSFVGMPDMRRTFTVGGTTATSVVVMFQGSLSLSSNSLSDTGFVRLTIDGQVQGPGDQVPVIANEDASASFASETGGHGFTWQTKPLAPGNHTARVLWRTDQGSQLCADARSLIVLHK